MNTNLMDTLKSNIYVQIIFMSEMRIHRFIPFEIYRPIYFPLVHDT